MFINNIITINNKCNQYIKLSEFASRVIPDNIDIHLVYNTLQYIF